MAERAVRLLLQQRQAGLPADTQRLPQGQPGDAPPRTGVGTGGCPALGRLPLVSSAGPVARRRASVAARDADHASTLLGSAPGSGAGRPAAFAGADLLRGKRPHPIRRADRSRWTWRRLRPALRAESRCEPSCPRPARAACSCSSAEDAGPLSVTLAGREIKPEPVWLEQRTPPLAWTAWRAEVGPGRRQRELAIFLGKKGIRPAATVHGALHSQVTPSHRRVSSGTSHSASDGIPDVTSGRIPIRR